MRTGEVPRAPPTVQGGATHDDGREDGPDDRPRTADQRLCEDRRPARDCRRTSGPSRSGRTTRTTRATARCTGVASSSGRARRPRTPRSSPTSRLVTATPRTSAVAAPAFTDPPCLAYAGSYGAPAVRPASTCTVISPRRPSRDAVAVATLDPALAASTFGADAVPVAPHPWRRRRSPASPLSPSPTPIRRLLTRASRPTSCPTRCGRARGDRHAGRVPGEPVVVGARDTVGAARRARRLPRHEGHEPERGVPSCSRSASWCGACRSCWACAGRRCPCCF